MNQCIVTIHRPLHDSASMSCTMCLASDIVVMAIAAATSENDSNVAGMGYQDLENGRAGGRSKTLPIEMILNEYPNPNTRSPNDVPSPDTGLLAAPGLEITFGENTSKSSSVVFCRICHEGENSGERLISPCRCRGSVGLVHRTCIEKWLTMVNIDSCEICKQKYSVMRHPRLDHSVSGYANLLSERTAETWWVMVYVLSF